MLPCNIDELASSQLEDWLGEEEALIFELRGYETYLISVFNCGKLRSLTLSDSLDQR